MQVRWPGSFYEFAKVLMPLANPEDSSLPAFHCVVPSIPGYGFSEAPKKSGFGLHHVAVTYDQLMKRLGYPHYREFYLSFPLSPHPTSSELMRETKTIQLPMGETGAMGLYGISVYLVLGHQYWQSTRHGRSSAHLRQSGSPCSGAI